MGLPPDELSIDTVDQQKNSALHLACLKVVLERERERKPLIHVSTFIGT